METDKKAILSQIELLLLINEPYEGDLSIEDYQVIQALKQCEEILRQDSKIVPSLIAV